MAYALETTLAGFFADLPLAGLALDLSEAVEVKSTAGGDVLTAAHGARYWFGTAVLGSNSFADHESQAARIRVLQRPGLSFLVSPRHLDGSDQGFATGQRITAVSNNRLVTFSGAGASKFYRRGTFFSANYGGLDRLFQLGEDATSTSGGSLGPVEVVPDLEPGFTANSTGTGTVVKFSAPVFRAIILPGTFRPVMLRGRRADGLAFDFRQQLLA